MRERVEKLRRPQVAVIDEARCVGCVRCIEACPVDAIVGAQGVLHTVVENWCIGCALCLPPCPVDCIAMAPPARAWTPELKQAAGERARARKLRRSTRYAAGLQDPRDAVAAALARRRR